MRRLAVWPPACDLGILTQVLRKRLGEGGEFAITYFGGHGVLWADNKEWEIEPIAEDDADKPAVADDLYRLGGCPPIQQRRRARKHSPRRQGCCQGTGRKPTTSQRRICLIQSLARLRRAQSQRSPKASGRAGVVRRGLSLLDESRIRRPRPNGSARAVTFSRLWEHGWSWIIKRCTSTWISR